MSLMVEPLKECGKRFRKSLLLTLSGNPYAVSTLVLKFGGATLDDARTLADYNVQVNSTITIEFISAVSSVTSIPQNNLQASVSRSQTTIVGNNVQSHLSTLAVGGVRSIPSGGIGGVVGGGAVITPNESKFSRTSFDGYTSDQPRPQSSGSTLRDLAMVASFDTANWSGASLNASDQGTNPNTGNEQRQTLSGNRDYTVWGIGSYTSIDNNRNRTGDDSRYNGDVWGYNLGLDRQFKPNLIGGVSLGYSDTNLTTTYNTGTYGETAWNVSPYVLYTPKENITVSGMVGYSKGDVDTTKTNQTITGSTDTKTVYASGNVTAKFKPIKDKPFDFTGKLAILIAHKSVAGYTESDGTVINKATSNTRQIKPGVEVTYVVDSAGTKIYPYAKVDYVHDFKDATNKDSGALNVGAGVRFASDKTGFSGALSAEKQYGRSDYSEHTITGLVAYNFAVSGEGSGLGIASPYIKSNLTGDGQVYSTGLRYQNAEKDMTLSFDTTYISASSVSPEDTVFRLDAKFDF